MIWLLVYLTLGLFLLSLTLYQHIKLAKLSKSEVFSDFLDLLYPLTKENLQSIAIIIAVVFIWPIFFLSILFSDDWKKAL